MKFKKVHKELAQKSYPYLQDSYHKSENNLKLACKSGDKKAMCKAMDEHQKYEYALLYRQTPEFKNNRSNNAYRYKRT